MRAVESRGGGRRHINHINDRAVPQNRGAAGFQVQSWQGHGFGLVLLKHETELAALAQSPHLAAQTRPQVGIAHPVNEIVYVGHGDHAG